MVIALRTETEVVVRGGDGEAFLDEHVHDVEVVALGGQHDGCDIWGEAGAVVLLLVVTVVEVQLWKMVIGFGLLTSPHQLRSFR